MDDVKELIARVPTGHKASRFAQHGDPRGPGRCHWCGAKLRAAKVANHPTIDSHRDARGDYGDNAFCGLRCGYMFGVQMAINGHRLQVRVPVVYPTRPESHTDDEDHRLDDPRHGQAADINRANKGVL